MQVSADVASGEKIWIHIDDLNTDQLKEALLTHQRHMLDLSGMGDAMIYDIKTRTRQMNILLNSQSR